MKKLSTNKWRVGWILLTNCAVMLFLIAAPIRDFNTRAQISKNSGLPVPGFSIVDAFAQNWTSLVFVGILLGGVILELRKNSLSPVVNIGFYVGVLVWIFFARSSASGSGAQQELYLGLVFVVIPLSAIMLIDIAFYAANWVARRNVGN